MELLKYALLGLIQGLTEFLPVSSSGHLVLAQHWLNLNTPGVLLEISTHVATLISVLVVYRRDIADIFRRRDWRYVWFILLGTLVTVAIALPLKDQLAALTDSPYAPRLVGAMLLLTALWLVLADLRLIKGKQQGQLGWLKVVLIGIGQAVAVLPGISRSGATIGAAIQGGIKREAAARFSFLLSVPVIAGAGILAIPDIAGNTAVVESYPGLALAFVLALCSGIAAIYILLWLLKRARLTYFALYCALLGAIALVVG